MGDRQSQYLAGVCSRRKRRINLFNADRDVLAVKLQIPIPKHGTRQHPGFQEDLKSVADTEDGAATARKFSDAPHYRGEFRNCASAEVIAVRKAAGQNNDIRPFQV
jgi:hypothetical protein